MRIGIQARRFGRNGASATATKTVDLVEALAIALEGAEPSDPIEISLSESVGLVLAEPVIADVDLPPFDRAGIRGYAVQSAEAVVEASLLVTAPWSDDGHEVGAGEAARVEAGDAMPIGADAVLSPEDVRDDGGPGRRVLGVLRGVEPGRGVVRRGATLSAGATLVEAGTRIKPGLIGLLASQGCVHPLCHRRVRVAIVAVGDHLVGPADPPVLHHERNAGNLAVGSLILAAGGMFHDLGAVTADDFPRAFDRALSAPLIVVLGNLDAGDRAAMSRLGSEPMVGGLAIEPGGGTAVGYEVVREPSDDGRPGKITSHVVRLPIEPVAAVTAATLLLLPLLSRLQGSSASESDATVPATWDAPQPATGDRLRAVPATLSPSPDGRLLARPTSPGPESDLPALSLADGLALFPPSSGPWLGGEPIRFAPFAPWTGRVVG